MWGVVIVQVHTTRLHNPPAISLFPAAAARPSPAVMPSQRSRPQQPSSAAHVLTICPSLAIFLISWISFFSCVCSPMRSRSSSRIALSSMRLFSRSSSGGVCEVAAGR